MPLPEKIGGLPKKQALLIGGGIAGLGILAAYRYRQQKAKTDATAAAAAAAQAPGTGTGTSDQIDPATGFPYGSIEDASALTSQSQYAMPGGYGYSGYGGGGYPSSGYPPSTVPGGYTSNAQWSQAAEDYLVNVTGADPNTVGNALGKYITGGVLLDAQIQVVNQAIAFVGYPPVAGPGGYPPSIRNAPPTPPPGPPPADVKVKIPNVIGWLPGPAIQDIKAVGFTTVINETPAAKGKVYALWPHAGTLASKSTIVLLKAYPK